MQKQRRDRLTELHQLAATQDGQFATGQALELGYTHSALHWLRETGQAQWLRVNVWRFAGVSGDPDAAISAFLAGWPRAVISHHSAAQQHRFKRVAAPQTPHITVPHGVKCNPDGIIVHHARVLEDRDIVTVGGVSYTARARTVCDLADIDDAWETLSLVDDAVAVGVRRYVLNRTATRLMRGRPGVGLVARATSPNAASEFRSWLERAGAHIYRAAHLPDPEWNVKIFDETGLIGVADALWPQWRVISEKEGMRYHTSPAQRRRDAKRFNRFGDARYVARRFTWEDVVHTPVDMAATVLRALRAAGADLDPATLPRQIVIPDRPFLV